MKTNIASSGILRRSIVLVAAVISITANAADVDSARTATVVAGEDYASPPGGQEWLLGSNYRNLWATPIEVELLDLRSFAGGLTPVMQVGGFQSIGLALKGRDGRDYTFRSIDKDYTEEVIPDVFEGTFVEDIMQDQISAQFPAVQTVAATIEQAAGVLGQPQARVVVMPDDVLLGDFREKFSGVLGTIVEFPQPVSNTNPGFHGATEIIGRDDFWRLRQASPDYLPDSRAYLRARIVDLFLNDWDRHEGNWRWGRFPGEPLLQPLPEDRDQIFASFEGLSLNLARLQGAPYVKFGDKYEPFHRLLHNGWDVDRHVLSDIDKDDWMRIARDVEARLTDDVLDGALRQMPVEYFELRGESIGAVLKQRRDRLVEMAEKYYAYHAETVDIYCTDKSETVTLEATDGSVIVSVAENGPAYFSRRFHPDETGEIRVYLHGGADTVVTKGTRATKIKIRIIGGPGSNTVDDTAGFAVMLYGSEGQSRIVGGNGSSLKTKSIDLPPRPTENDVDVVPQRDWGSFAKPVYVGKYHNDPGLVVGGGIDYTRYGFRRYPWASRHVLKGSWGFAAENGDVEYKGDFRTQNPKIGFQLEARYSGLDYLRFHGFGNGTPYDDNNDQIYEQSTTQFTLFPSFVYRRDDKKAFAVGPIAKYTDSTDTNANTILGQQQPLGFGEFGQVGLRARGVYDNRGPQKVLSPGWLVEVDGAHYVEGWDVDNSFSYVDVRLGRWFQLSEPLLASINVRAKKVWGDYPFTEAAYIGGNLYPLGTRWNRWAGDSSIGVLGSLRWTLMEMRGIFPGNLGVFGMANTARVYVDGEDSSKWHPSYAAGLVLTAFDHAGAIHLGVGDSPDSGFFVMLRGSFAKLAFK